jgi:hypothetical protein
MIDGFLVFMLYSLVPMLFPTGLPPGTERALFLTWAVGQVMVVAALVLYLAWRTARARWQTRLAVIAWALTCFFVALSYMEIAWDSVVVYDRVVKVALHQKGLWSGYVSAGTPYVFGYPPGASLSVLWGRFLRMPSANMAHAAVLWLWMTNWLVEIVEREGNRKSAPLFLLLFAIGPQVFWHVVFFYNNIVYALLWTTLVTAPLHRVKLKPWQLCGYALALVWFRPQLLLALVPIASTALIELLLDGLNRRRLVWFVIAALVAFAGARFWERRVVQQTALQEQRLLDNQKLQTAGRDASALELRFDAPPEQAPPVTTTQAKPRARVVREAIAWASGVAYRAYGPALLALLVLPLCGLWLGRRWGLAVAVALLTPLTFIAGTAQFALANPDYQSIPGSLERLLLVTPLLAAAVAVAVEARLSRLSDERR